MRLKSFVKSKFPMLAEYLIEARIQIRILQHSVKRRETRINKLKNMYRKRMGWNLDFENPKRYTEKIQVRKLTENNQLYSELSDKLSVRNWVSNKIGAKYLIPLLGAWDSFDEINFDSLPDEFVLKTNNASGTNVIVNDKKMLNMKLLRQKFNFWMKMDYSNYVGYEMHYANIKPQIIAEELIKSPGEADLQDYKFLCFDGAIKYIWVDTGRYHNHKRTIFDANWNKQDWQQHTYESEDVVPAPANLEKMKKIVAVLAEGFDHVRVDLYNADGKIYFGEMTFTNAGGFEKYYPDAMDYQLGALWNMRDRTSK